MTDKQMLITFAVLVLGTVLTRFLPYILFPSGKKTPAVVTYLGKVLAPAVFGLLVVYCLRNVDFASGTHGIPELLAILTVVLTYVWKRNMMLSMLSATVLYMVLVQTVF